MGSKFDRVIAGSISHTISTGTVTIVSTGRPGVLHRAVVNTGAASAVVTLRYADDNSVIAVIDAANSDVGREYLLDLGLRGLESVISGGSADVTITYSGG